MTRTIIENAAISTVDDRGTEYDTGYLVVADSRIEAIGSGQPLEVSDVDRRIDASGCLITPGLVNTHHHLFQWATRGMAADATLFEWLTQLYPIWARMDAETTYAAACAGLATLAASGTTTVADHHYVFPTDGGDQIDALVAACSRLGMRAHLVRGLMDRGASDGGLPPDNVVEATDAALDSTQRTIDTFHDPAPNAMVRIAVGPCSPFTVTERMMSEAVRLARSKGVRLHTHLAETLDEHRQCVAEVGRTPTEYLDSLRWLNDDVWVAHAVHLDAREISRLGASGTGVAHCPTSNGRLGVGVASLRELLDAGVATGLGVDGAASNESGGLSEELHKALLQARQRRGPQSLTVREALWLGTMGGARCLGRHHEIGSLEPGKLADIAVWRLDGLAHAGIADPVAAMVLGAAPSLALLLVGGHTVVSDGELRTADQATLATQLRVASRRLR